MDRRAGGLTTTVREEGREDIGDALAPPITT
jgi:hypothetical protein